MVPGQRDRGERRGSTATILLVVSLVPVLVLAWLLQSEVRSHRTSAKSMLADCAQLAAEDYARRLTITFDVAVLMPLQLLLRGAKDQPSDWLPTLLPEDAALHGALPRLVEAFYRMGPDGEILHEPLPAVISTDWLRSELADCRVDRASTYGAGFRIVRMSDEQVVLAYTSVGDVIMGFVGRGQNLAEGFESALEMGQPILAPLAARAESEPEFALAVRDRKHALLYESAPMPGDAVRGAAMVTARHGELRIEAGLEPSAERLLVGGIPQSRPWQIVLLVLASVVPLAAALLLFRREQQMARLRADFVANVSHELRTPLAQIRMFAETLRLDRFRNDAERERSIEILDTEARRLDLLINSTLQFARRERGALQVHLQRQRIAPLLREVVASFEPLAAARGAHIEIDIDTESDASVDVDGDALRTMLNNVLDNAVKHGPANQAITVQCRSVNGSVEIAVDDEGSGIKPVYRDDVWKRYWRGPDAAGAGAGIGLALVRDLVELHDGSVAVSDAPSGGARFAIYLPEARDS